MHELNCSLEKENEISGLTKSEIANILKKNKSIITKLFSGKQNMTIESLSYIASAMNRKVDIKLSPITSPKKTNLKSCENHDVTHYDLIGT